MVSICFGPWGGFFVPNRDGEMDFMISFEVAKFDSSGNALIGLLSVWQEASWRDF